MSSAAIAGQNSGLKSHSSRLRRVFSLQFGDNFCFLESERYALRLDKYTDTVGKDLSDNLNQRNCWKYFSFSRLHAELADMLKSA